MSYFLQCPKIYTKETSIPNLQDLHLIEITKILLAISKITLFTLSGTEHASMFGFTDTHSLRRNPSTSFEFLITWWLISMQSSINVFAAYCICRLKDP